MRYNILIEALQLFEEEWLWDLGKDGCTDSLKRMEEDGNLDSDQLREQYSSAMLDTNLSWKEVANNSSLFFDNDMYSEFELKSIIEYYLNEFINPNNVLTLHEREETVILLNNILKSREGWIDVITIYNELKESNPKLKLYHIYNFKDYFDIDLEVKKENSDKLWVVDALKLKDT